MNSKNNGRKVNLFFIEDYTTPGNWNCFLSSFATDRHGLKLEKDGPTLFKFYHRQPKLKLPGKGVKKFTNHRWGVTFLLDASVSRYRRSLKIRDFLWEIKCWDLRTLNNVKSSFSSNEINEKDLPAIYSTVFRCLLVILQVFWLYCITTVTPFIRRREKGHLAERSRVTYDKKLLYTLSS